MTKFSRTLDAYHENDPSVEVNQRWIVFDLDGEVLRRVRIIAPYPDPDADGRRMWITKDEPAKMKLSTRYLNVCPEYNLRYVFELESSALPCSDQFILDMRDTLDT